MNSLRAMMLERAPMNVKIAHAMFGKAVEERPGEMAELLRELHRTVTVPRRVLLSAELFQTIALHPPIAQWNAFMSSGLHEVFLEMALDEGIYKDGDDYIVNVVSTIWNIMFMAGMTEEHKNDKVTDVMLEKGPALFDMFWERRELLQMQTARMVFYREMVSKITYSYITIRWKRDQLPALFETRVAHVALLCWHHAKRWSPDEVALDGIFMISTEASSEDRDRFTQEVILPTIGARAFTERLCRELRTAQILDISLFRRVRIVYDFGHETTMRSALGDVETGFHRALVAALRRQQQKGKRKHDWDIYSRSISLFHWITVRGPVALLELIEDEDFMSFVLARGTILGAQSDEPETIDDWSRYLQLVSTMISMFQQEDRGVVARALLRSFTSEIKKLWLPTLDRLAKSQARERGTSVCSGMMYGAWLKFGNTVGLNEGEERKRMEVEKDGDNARKELPGPPYCYWKECGFHEKKPPRATSLCSGCGSVQYCDQKCQTRDWKEGGHKKACKTLKAAKKPV